MLKALFLGTPGMAVPFLEHLYKRASIPAVVTSPDQPAGRGYELKPPEVKTAAFRLGLTVLQPQTLKEETIAERIRAFKADIGIVVAYGKLLPSDILSIPRLGFLNVHFSLLPKYRGAAPIQWALLHGETETGVTLFWLDEGMDTGPIFLQKKLTILEEDDADALRNKLVDLGVQSLEEALRRMEAGDVARIPQAGEPSRAPLIRKEDGHIDWNRPAQAISWQIRALTPWPGSRSGSVKILKAVVSPEPSDARAGTVIRLVSGEGPVVKCGQDALTLLQVQPEGKKPMSAWSWWQGARLKVGAVI